MAEDFEVEEQEEEEKDEYTKPTWLDTRHSWYANLNVTVKQLDIVIGIACGGLVLTFIMIALDAMNII